MKTTRIAARFAAIVCSLVLAAGCTSTPHQSSTGSQAQLFAGMGSHTRPVSGASAEAQKYFDQGLTWTYAFNHDEAIRSYTEAARLSPNCAMAWWGIALCHGPHINNPMMSEERSTLAWQSLAKAKAAAAAGASPTEKALIDALAARYTWPIPADRAPLDQGYARAMEGVYRQYPNDNDVATLYAESLMDLQPWDLWTLDGQPKGRTLEVVSVLEGVLAANPRHPGAAHLYIHAVEASKQPERALASADTLRTLVPVSSHLVHMPSHIDARVGAWDKAMEANRVAMAADKAYKKLSPKQDFYRIYMSHNSGFLAFACMMAGRSEEGIRAAKAAVDGVPAEWARDNAAIVDGYMTIHMEALKRFGKWDAILALPEPPQQLKFTRAMWRAHRAIALAAKGNTPAAQSERQAFTTACSEVPEGAIAQINPAHTVLKLAGHVIDAEIAYAGSDYDVAIDQLTEAIKIEDELQYMEPPDWMLPARHTLGSVLLDAGRPAEAERVYRKDLAKWPNNGWSLLGLSRALAAQGKTAESDRAQADFARAWKDADMTPHASCLCARHKKTVAGASVK